MRASRLLSLLLHLQVRGQLTGPELAARLSVSERTVQRDVEALVAAGIPVRSVRGPAGGYALPGGYRTRLTGLGAAEAQALAFLGLSGAAEALGLSEQLDTAQHKLWAALSGDAREHADRSAQRFHLDPVRWYGSAEPTPALAAVAEAVWLDRRLRLRYAARGGKAGERTVDPLGLVLAAGDWYLVARRDGARRTYRISRVLAAQALDEPVARPAGYDLAADWAEARSQLESRHELVTVTLLADPAVLPGLRRVVAVSGQHLIDVAAVEPVRLEVPFEGLTWAASALLGLGAGVEVLAPAALRDRVAAESRAIAERYR
ncbi:transcriptional regulator [Actinocatenispora thailandica]|uniref:Transcriptional regulator n=1 Tax=Actinocatenispora thailandica TaxID=227318 RepID=A0A7R7DPX4_9ACTN|nr:transcriptional regulator [Actinocatenispora thailandica]